MLICGQQQENSVKTVRNHLSHQYNMIFICQDDTFLSPKKRNSHLLLSPPALHHSPPQEFCPFLQLLVIVPVHLPPSYLKNILTSKGRCWTLPILQNGDRDGRQHLLFQQPCLLLRLSRLQQGREGVAQGEPALQGTYWQFTRHKSLLQLWLKLDPSRRRCVVCCCWVVSQFVF